MGQILWLVRHGHRFDFAYPDWFETAIRRYDPPLSALGFRQVSQLTQRLKTETIDHLFCSPFLRAIQTAYPIAEALDLTLNIERGLGEWLNPDWMMDAPETEPWKQLIKHYPRIDADYQSLVLPTYPETEREVMARMKKIAQQLVKEFSGSLLIVGHSSTVSGVVAGLLRNDEILKSSVASLTQLIYEGNQWQLTIKADTSFLSD